MTFPEYLYFLLPSALKKNGKKASGWWMLSAVLGRRAQRLKDTILSVREQTMILTCAEALLPVFGQERDMPRLKGETARQYRLRLLQKYKIAEMAGTNEGILTAVKALGHDNVTIEPMHQTDPDRWAEATVWISGTKAVIPNREIIQQEINNQKPASAKLELAIMQEMQGTIYVGAFRQTTKIIEIRQVD